MALAVALSLAASERRIAAQDSPFPLPAGLEDAVEFWKQVFTRYSFAEVVLFDPLDPGKIYSVLRATDNEQGRALVAEWQKYLASVYATRQQIYNLPRSSYLESQQEFLQFERQIGPAW